VDVLWTPWRHAYITGEKAKTCVLCAAVNDLDNTSGLIVHRGDRCLAMLNLFPYSNGHIMVVPYRHVGALTDLLPHERAVLMELTGMATEVLGRVMSPAGFNVGMNLGTVAGAGLADHIHMHVVPRWAGDTNYMTVVANTRLIPESLQSTRATLEAAWEKRDDSGQV
jgi:ATP adenylyltransferase